MEYEVLYSTTADTVEIGDVIGFNGDSVQVVNYEDKGDSIVVIGVSETTGDLEVFPLDPNESVDILGN